MQTTRTREPRHFGVLHLLMFYPELLFDRHLALGQTQEKPEKMSRKQAVIL